jgi:hypothetical protein
VKDETKWKEMINEGLMMNVITIPFGVAWAAEIVDRYSDCNEKW